jgi:hypothetical protein
MGMPRKFRASKVGIALSRSDKPVPRLSKRIRGQKEAIRPKKLANAGLHVHFNVRDGAGYEDHVERTNNLI